MKILLCIQIYDYLKLFCHAAVFKVMLLTKQNTQRY